MPYRDPEKQRAWRAAHRAKAREYSLRYYYTHKEQVVKYRKKYRKKNASKIKEWYRAYHARPEIKERSKIRYLSNKEKVHKNHKIWIKNNPSKARAIAKRSYMKRRHAKLEYNKQWKDRRRRDEAALITTRMIRALTPQG